jgi:hypothetical protein
MEEQTYSLQWNPNPPLGVARLVTFAVAAGLYTVIAWLGVIGLPMGFMGVSALFIGMGFLIPFVLWFSGWGIVIGVIGAIVGAGILAGMPIAQSVPFGLVEAVVQIPMLAVYRSVGPRVGVSPIGKDVFTVKGFLFFLVWPVIIVQLWSAVSGNLTLYAMGFIPTDALPLSITGWWIGNMLVVVVIGTILCGVLTPVVERLGLTVRGIIT